AVASLPQSEGTSVRTARCPDGRETAQRPPHSRALRSSSFAAIYRGGCRTYMPPEPFLYFEHSHRFALRPASVAGAFISGRRTELRGRRSGSIETVSRILTRWGEIGAGLHADSWIWS